MITASRFVVFATFAGLAVLPDIIYILYKKWKSATTPDTLTKALLRRYPGKNSHTFHKVIFFPDEGVSCRRTFAGRICYEPNCHGIHHETSLNVLIHVMKFSQHRLDVCVYMITCGMLASALIECRRRGLLIRVITEERNSGEEGEMNLTGSKVGKLRAAGINVRCKSSSFWMHHKFLVADSEVIVTGSFNWTNQAVMGNFENLLITNEKNLVHPYISEFEKLWNELEPVELRNQN